MDVVRAFYADKRRVKPGRFTRPLLREEEAAIAGATSAGPADGEPHAPA